MHCKEFETIRNSVYHEMFINCLPKIVKREGGGREGGGREGGGKRRSCSFVED